MVDTVRSMSELLTTFADGQAAGSITEQDMRDFIVSSIGQTGWADYQDTASTSASPQVLAAGVENKITINGGSSRVQELPFGISALWDTENNVIPISVPGTTLAVTFEATMRRANGSTAWSYDSFLDIGGGGTIDLYRETKTITKNGADFVLLSTPVYCLDTWATNGGEIVIVPQVDAHIYDARVIVHHLHRGRGTY